MIKVEILEVRDNIATVDIDGLKLDLSVWVHEGQYRLTHEAIQTLNQYSIPAGIKKQIESMLQAYK